jgi:hypothetical protein
MDHPWKDWYNWRNGRWQGLEDAAQFIERIQSPLNPKQTATMLRALIDIEEKTTSAPNETPAWKEYILAAGKELHQG